MKVYFTSCMRAALKLNGEYVGLIDGIERFTEVDDEEEILAEVFPCGDRQARHFFLGKARLCAPPPFLTVATDGIAYRVCVNSYLPNDGGVKILCAENFNGYGVTLFNLCGKSYASYDGKQSRLYELGDGFDKATLSEGTIGGFPAVLIVGERRLGVICPNGEMLYCGRADDYSAGDMLRITQNYASCAGYCARREYAYDGKSLNLCQNTVVRRYEPTEAVKHFAFFEGLLFGADCEEYLSEELKPQTDAIKSYLGDYSQVLVPTGDFYAKHGDVKGVALAYPVKENLFNLKYYTVDMTDGKIDNIKTAEL